MIFWFILHTGVIISKIKVYIYIYTYINTYVQRDYRDLGVRTSANYDHGRFLAISEEHERP